MATKNKRSLEDGQDYYDYLKEGLFSIKGAGLYISYPSSKLLLFLGIIIYHIYFY